MEGGFFFVLCEGGRKESTLYVSLCLNRGGKKSLSCPFPGGGREESVVLSVVVALHKMQFLHFVFKEGKNIQRNAARVSRMIKNRIILA